MYIELIIIIFHILTCSMYPEYTDETTGLVCNKLRRELRVKVGVRGRYNFISPLKCMCGYRFWDIDLDKPDWDQTLVQYLGKKILSAFSFLINQDLNFE